jgi:hypothetical protein
MVPACDSTNRIASSADGADITRYPPLRKELTTDFSQRGVIFD